VRARVRVRGKGAGKGAGEGEAFVRWGQEKSPHYRTPLLRTVDKLDD
jgi:hypothetical protein